MADTNTYLTNSMVTKESARTLVNQLVFVMRLNRQYDKDFKGSPKQGAIMQIRKPPRFVGRSGDTMQVEAAVETSATLTLSELDGCDIEYNSTSWTLAIDDFRKRFIRPMVSTVSNKVDFKGLQLYKKVFNMTGTPGTTPTSLRDGYLLAHTYLDTQAAPRDGQRAVCISSLMNTYIVDALKGLFQATQQLAAQYRTGRMGDAADFEWLSTENAPTHTFGNYTASATVNGANQTGSSIITAGWGASVTVKEGDILQFAGSNSANPQSRQSNGLAANFVVTSDTTSTGAGAMTIPIYPPLVPGTAAQFCTVDASPTNGGAVTVLAGASGRVSRQGLAFHPDAFVMGSVDLPIVNNAELCERVASDKLGISIRLWRDGDIRSNSFPTRLDVLYGFVAVYPELACRIASQG